MNINTITQLIGSLGFPIVACCAMAWYVYKIGKQHREEVEKLSEVIQNNTIAINRMLEKTD